MNTYSWIVPIVLFSIMAFIFVINFWQSYYPFRQWRWQKKQQFWKYWESISNLETIYIRLASIVGVALLILFFALYFQVILIPFGLSNLEDNEIRNLAFAFLGTVTGLGGLFGVYLAILRAKENTNQNEIAKSQANTAEQGMITDRINKAVEGLGKRDGKDPVIEVRLGALYALERIAKDSERDHIQILEILCAYIRTNSHKNIQPSGGSKVREDIQAAITIIGRREKWPNGKKRLEEERKEDYILNLNGCNLRQARLIKANLSHAHLLGTDLSNARLILANLSHAQLINAKMIRAELLSANMQNALLSAADITEINIKGAQMDNIRVYRAFAHIGDFSDWKGITQDTLDQMFCGIDVKIPDTLTRPKHWTKEHLYLKEFKEAYIEFRKKVDNVNALI